MDHPERSPYPRAEADEETKSAADDASEPAPEVAPEPLAELEPREPSDGGPAESYNEPTDGEPSEPSDTGAAPTAQQPPAPAWWEARERVSIRRVWDPATQSWRDASDLPTPDHSPAISPTRAGVIGGIVGAVLSALLVLAGTQFLANRTVVVERQAPGARANRAGIDPVVAIAERAKPWVVHINTRVRTSGILGTQEAQGAGSGVIIRSDGHIITNAHVVEGATAVEVVLASGETLEGRLVGSDLDTDVAVVKVNRSDLPSAVIGSARNLQVGELTVAIGSPLGLSHSVTSGIVSALGRTTQAPTGRPLVDMIQTDASITRGNSGGALLDGDGALIGINSSIAVDPEVGAEGIGFAIPVDIAKRVADELIATGRATHPYIGIVGGTIDAETARQFNVTEGARISELVAGGPADRAGLEPGDIIVGLGGEKVDSMEVLIALVASRRVGEDVSVDYLRPVDGRELQRRRAELTIGDRPRDR